MVRVSCLVGKTDTSCDTATHLPALADVCRPHPAFRSENTDAIATGCLGTPRRDKRRRTNADAVPAVLSGPHHRNMACPPDNIFAPSPIRAMLGRGKRGPAKQLQCSVDAHPKEESVQRVINRRAVADPRLRHRELQH
ncbi:hypothetical protein HPB47_009235 [Ixodes persulcatus]|uniref:Uncharacterized protein n=1 Tax=Ixodes persulcatus TaxID=34615 RepID=A0AC60P2S9_IXOPE|nr:hypothetical protein HPB47_009235 [Ixodes persulcatus]